MHSVTRRQQGVPHPPISYPLERGAERTEKASASGHQLYRPVSPPRTPPRNRRPSVTVPNPLSFLSRNSGHAKDASASQPAPKIVRISEPRFSNALDLNVTPRSGTLGSGATVVRTPYDALGGTRGVQRDFDGTLVMDISKESESHEEEAVEEEGEEAALARDRCISRALPPLPLNIGHPYKSHSVDENASRRAVQTRASCPTRPPPAAPVEEQALLPSSSGAATLRPSLKSQSTEFFPPVPAVPAHLTNAPPQPTFEPILVSSVPSTAIDPSKIIVTIESSTVTHKTTLNTLVSRPSYLADWLKEVFKKSQAEERGDEDDEDDTESTFSRRASGVSAFFSIFHNHLNSQGLLSPTSSNMHIFLDRPSAPYAHILTYLRSPTSTPPTLPRAAQLTSSSSSRLEALYELRDEAVYLGLEELAKLCTDELAIRCRARTTSHSSHAHTQSQSSIRTTGRRGSNASIVAFTRPSPLSASTDKTEEIATPSGDVVSDASSSSSTGSPAESRRVSAATVCSTPIRSPTRSASQGSLVGLYNHSPVTATYPRRPPAAIPNAPKSAPDVTTLLRARVAKGIGSAAIQPSVSEQPKASPPTAFTPGLQARFAQMRTREEGNKFNSVKTRPPAEWI